MYDHLKFLTLFSFTFFTGNNALSEILGLLFFYFYTESTMEVQGFVILPYWIWAGNIYSSLDISFVSFCLSKATESPKVFVITQSWSGET